MALTAAYIVPHPPLAVPEVGHGQERAIQATIDGYEEVARRIARQAPDDIVIISPHTAYYSDWIHIAAGASAEGDLAQFGAADVHVSLTYDPAFRDALERAATARDIPAGPSGPPSQSLDHGMMVPLSYLKKAYPADRYQAVSIGGSALPRPTLMEFGRCISFVADALDRRCVLLVSGDLAHKLKEDGPYGFHPAAPEFDERFTQIVESGDVNAFAAMDPALCKDAAECGLSGFVMMAGALDQVREDTGDAFSSELISYEGPFGVGYGVAAFERVPHEEAVIGADGAAGKEASGMHAQDPLVDLACRTIGFCVREGRTPSFDDLGVTPRTALGEDAPAQAGCFVSIHVRDTDELRGCIGTIQPTCGTLAEEIIQNAVSASMRDPRFPPIQPSELDGLSINVDVLFPPEPTKVADLDPRRFGVIVTKGVKRGLLLPDLPGVDTPEQQITIACAKAGISTFGPEVELERFEVVRHT